MGTFNRHGFNTVHNSQLPKRERRGWQRRVGIAACCVILALIVVLLIALAIANLVSGAPANPSTEPDTQDTGIKPNKLTYADLTVSTDQVAFGALIQVDAEHAYTHQGTSHLTYVKTALASIPKDSYALNDYGKLDAVAAEAMARMLNDQYAATNYMLLVRCTWTDDEGSWYYDINRYKTGLIVNLLVRPDPEKNEHSHWVNFPAVDTWFKENAYKYGYILTEDADDVRYVGVAHATYMHNNELTLANYLEELRKHGADKPLEILGADNHTYLVYYTANTTTISVPTNCAYTVSGDNAGGIIVTADLSQAVTGTTPTTDTTLVP